MNRRNFLETLGFSAIGVLAHRSFAYMPINLASMREMRCEGLGSNVMGHGKRPNVILILCDDLGWGDIGYWQNRRNATNKISTPALDKMIQDGVVCTNAYTTAPVCAPARASMLTGKHQGHCNLRDNMFDRPIATDLTIASVMKAAGYSTWHIGKWGIGGGYESNGEKRIAMACDAGFDYSYGYPGHSHGHSFYHWEPKNVDWRTHKGESPIVENISNEVKSNDKLLNRYKKLSTGACDFERDNEGLYYRRLVADSEVKYCYDTDLFAAKIKQLVKTHLEDSDEKQKPFFCYACFTTVHGTGNSSGLSAAAEMDLSSGYTLHIPPSNAEPANVDGNGKPCGIEIAYPPINKSDKEWGGGLKWEKGLKGALPFKGTRTTANKGYNPKYTDHKKYPGYQGRYATAITRLDSAIRDIRNFLEVKGLDDNTLIIFTSDNGPAAEHLGRWSADTMDSNGPFTGMKRWIYEGGLREPAIAVWPGTIPSGGNKPRQCSVPFQFPAWMATLADVAGLPQPAHCDGVSILQPLTGQAGSIPCLESARIYAEYVDGGSGQGFGFEQMVRDGDFVLLRNSARKTGVELYNVIKDPAQRTNLANDRAYANRVKIMTDMLAQSRIPCSKVGDAFGAKGYANNTPGRLEADALAIPNASALHREFSLDNMSREHLYFVHFFDKGAKAWPWVPNFRTMKADGGAYALSMLDLRATLKARKGAYGVAISGVVDVSETGDVTFSAKGAGGCQLWLHELHALEYEKGDLKEGKSITLNLAKGLHPFRLYLTTDNGYDGLCHVSLID